MPPPPKFVWKKKKLQKTVKADISKAITVLQKTVKADINLDISKENLVLNRSKQHLEQEHCKWHVNICPKTDKLNQEIKDELKKLIRKIKIERGDQVD